MDNKLKEIKKRLSGYNLQELDLIYIQVTYLKDFLQLYLKEATNRETSLIDYQEQIREYVILKLCSVFLTKLSESQTFIGEVLHLTYDTQKELDYKILNKLFSRKKSLTYILESLNSVNKIENFSICIQFMLQLNITPKDVYEKLDTITINKE